MAATRYLAWGRSRGMLVDKVGIGASPFDGMRGVVAARDLKPMEVVCSVPFAATISAETAPLSLLGPGCPNYVHVHKLFASSRHPRDVEAAQLQFYYLGGLVAHLRKIEEAAGPAGGASSWGPYLDTVTPPERDADAEKSLSEEDSALVALLGHRSDVAARGIAELGRRLLRRDQRRRAAGAAQLRFLDATDEAAVARRRHASSAQDTAAAALPTAAEIRASIDAVISRAVSVPRGCAPTAPACTLPEYFDRAAADAPQTVALIPVVDMVNAPRPGQRCNATLYTCGPAGAGGGHRNLIAMVATRPVAKGDELLLPYHVSHPGSTFFRWGFTEVGDR